MLDVDPGGVGRDPDSIGVRRQGKKGWKSCLVLTHPGATATRDGVDLAAVRDQDGESPAKSVSSLVDDGPTVLVVLPAPPSPTIHEPRFECTVTKDMAY